MAGWDDVRRIALALPEAQERPTYGGNASWRVHDKLFAWERPLRPSDREALGQATPDGPILGVRVEHLLAKEVVLAAGEHYFTTPHFDRYPAVLVVLDRIPMAELEEVITEAWLVRAPVRLARAYLEARGDDARG